MMAMTRWMMHAILMASMLGSVAPATWADDAKAAAKPDAKEGDKDDPIDWRKLAQALHARFLTRDFVAGLTFLNAVTEVAERADHHPDVSLTYAFVANDCRMCSRGSNGNERTLYAPGLQLGGRPQQPGIRARTPR